jgi:capsular polysaccharide transport system permease protein
MKNQTSKMPFWRRRSVLCIGLPTLLVFIYFSMVAQPSYESQAKIIVQNNDRESMMAIPGISAGMIGSAGDSSIKDAYLLLEYMKSPELIRKLDDLYQIREHYASPVYDQFRKLNNDANFDDLIAYFQKQLHLKVSSDSGIISLSLQAFDAELAQSLLTSMIEESEQTINHLNHRILSSTTDIAARELQKTKEDLKVIRQRMFEFQVSRKVISPDAEIQMLLLNLSELDGRILSKKTELKTKEQFLKEDTFELKSIRQEIIGLEGQRNEEAGSLFVQDGTSIPNSAHEYESLKLESEFALQSYTAALAAYEKAKLEALRQEKFLLTISAPTQPIDATYPEPWLGTLTALILVSLLYGIARLVIATILDHTV